MCGGTTSSTPASAEHTPEPFDAEHPLFLLYTSGTTGKPKGIMHTSGGYLTQSSYTVHTIFDVKPESDVFWCTADIGWVTGHTYGVYGPLSNGITEVLYEGTPNTPDEHRHFQIIEKYGVTIYYTAPTLVRTFMKWGREIPDAHDLSSLRLLGSVGEPINHEAWRWYRTVFGADNVPVVDTWWQTETGSAMISPLPGVTAAKPGSAMTPLPGISAKIVDDHGDPLQPDADNAKNVTGYLVLDQPWPSMLRGIWGDPERYRDTYWSKFAEQGFYFAGDGARFDPDGAIWVLGRIDDVMNVSGHRISTAEVESALVGHSGVAEAAVVGVSRRHHRPGHLRVRRHGCQLRSRTTGPSTSCAVRWPGRSRRSPSHARSMWCRSCPRPAAAKSCAGYCATSPNTASWVTRRRCSIPACSTRSRPPSSDAGRLRPGWGRSPRPAGSSR
jgi:acetyl-CoA synthetase